MEEKELKAKDIPKIKVGSIDHSRERKHKILILVYM